MPGWSVDKYGTVSTAADGVTGNEWTDYKAIHQKVCEVVQKISMKYFRSGALQHALGAQIFQVHQMILETIVWQGEGIILVSQAE